MSSTIQSITERIIKRSKKTRSKYLAAMKDNMRPGPRRKRLSEGNLAHAAAACPLHEKTELLGAGWPNIGIITAYNDCLLYTSPSPRDRG